MLAAGGCGGMTTSVVRRESGRPPPSYPHAWINHEQLSTRDRCCASRFSSLVASNVDTVMMTEEWAHIVLTNPQLKEAVRITRATGAPPEMQISSSADASGSTAGEPSAKRSRDG